MGADMKLAIYVAGIGTLIGGAASFGVISFLHMVIGVNPGAISGPIGALTMFATMAYAAGAARIVEKDTPHD